MQILTQEVWCELWDSAFPTNILDDAGTTDPQTTVKAASVPTITGIISISTQVGGCKVASAANIDIKDLGSSPFSLWR